MSSGWCARRKTIVVKRGGGHGFSACGVFLRPRIAQGAEGAHRADLGQRQRHPLRALDARVQRPQAPPVWYNGMIASAGALRHPRRDLVPGRIEHGRRHEVLPQDESVDRRLAQGLGPGRFPLLLRAIAALSCGGADLAGIREAQTATLSLPNTGMAVTIDIGSYPDCHCPNKQDVGKRLALWALAKDYGRKDLVCSGPLYKSMARRGRQDPHPFRLCRQRPGNPRRRRRADLLSRSPGPTRNSSRPRHGSTAQTVVVSSPAVPQPVAVRCAWDDKAVPNLMNKEGLPATTFSSETQ